MSKQVTTSLPKLFIGLDIHKKSWKFHFTTDLVIGSGHSFPPCVETIKNYVDKNYRNYEVSIAYEAGCCGYRPARSFKEYRWDTYVFCLKVGRKLLSKILAVIKTETPYREGVNQ